MPFRLVAPDGVLYVINDTGVGGPDVEALKHRRSDLPPPKNFHQLFGWADAVPHGKRCKAVHWQLLEDVKWAEFDGVFIPLVGSASNALKIFNTHCGTSHILDGRFRHLYSGQRPFEGGWRLTERRNAGIGISPCRWRQPRRPACRLGSALACCSTRSHCEDAPRADDAELWRSYLPGGAGSLVY